MRLFIAEKPSVAKAIVAELGCVTRGDGFITCKDGSVVTWCFGHLLEQAEPDAYLPDDVPRTKKGSKVWRFEDLPIYPKNWKLLPKNDKGVKKQLATIGKLLKKASLVVHAGDPDREEQLLVDEVLVFRTGQCVDTQRTHQPSRQRDVRRHEIGCARAFKGRLAARHESVARLHAGAAGARQEGAHRRRSRADADARPGRET